ncbi:MAG TPA: hypothetical protein VFN79_04440 [Steroidobacteraceae bacterium]|nr:hypothetical protein [Steroidobacteraceae bacterium]
MPRESLPPPAWRSFAAIRLEHDLVTPLLLRREESWTPAVLGAMDSLLELRSIGLALPLAQVYEGEAV